MGVSKWGGMEQICYAFFCHFLGYLYGKCVQIIGLKAPGNYCEQIWFNEILILLCEGPKPPNAMISGFLGLV